MREVGQDMDFTRVYIYNILDNLHKYRICYLNIYKFKLKDFKKGER